MCILYFKCLKYLYKREINKNKKDISMTMAISFTLSFFTAQFKCPVIVNLPGCIVVPLTLWCGVFHGLRRNTRL